MRCTHPLRIVPVEEEKQVPPLAVAAAADFGRNDRSLRGGRRPDQQAPFANQGCAVLLSLRD